MNISTCIIIGSSRGLGASLVDEFLARSPLQVIGIARTGTERIRTAAAWSATGRYRHVQADIAAPGAADALAAVVAALPREPVCVIFNAAHIEKDLTADGGIEIDAVGRVNAVGVAGLAAVLKACQGHLLKYGGLFVGITSHWGSVAPLFLPYVSYPASKAYLDMVLRCLRAAWRRSVRVVTVTIGNVKDPGAVSAPRWFIPTYAMAAKRIVRALLREKTPAALWYPRWHGLVYQCILRFIPSALYAGIFSLYFKIERAGRKGAS